MKMVSQVRKVYLVFGLKVVKFRKRSPVVIGNLIYILKNLMHRN